VAWAQSDQNQPPAPPPVPAFGPEKSRTAGEREPADFGHRSAWIGTPCGARELPSARLAFQRVGGFERRKILWADQASARLRGVWKSDIAKALENYDVAMDYIGGVSYYDTQGVGLEQLQQFDVDNRINWRRGQLANPGLF